MLVKAVEFFGFCLVVGFWWFVWPPLVLLGTGLVLLLFANTRGARPARLGVALAAARRAYAQSRESDPMALRRVS